MPLFVENQKGTLASETASPGLYQCRYWAIICNRKLVLWHCRETGGPEWRNYDGTHFCAHGPWWQATDRHDPTCAPMAVRSVLDRGTSHPHTMFSNTTMTSRH